MSASINSQIDIRIADINDAPVIARFTGSMALETEGMELDADVVLSGVANAIKNEKFGFYVVAQKDGAAIACMMVTYEWSDWRNGVQWWLQSVYVEPDSRNMGVFSEMFDFVVGLASKEENVCGIRLYVDRSNASAISTYESLGFTPTDYLLFEKTLQ